MRLLNYLNESFEDKLFGMIDDFMKQKNIKSADLLETDDNWRELVKCFKDTFQVASIKVLPTRSEAESMTAVTTRWGITIRIPTGPLTRELKAQILAVLFHELAHTLQDKEADPIFLSSYLEAKPAGNRNLFTFALYFLQSIERPTQALGYAASACVAGIPLIDDLEKLKADSAKVKDFAEINAVLDNVKSHYRSIMKPYAANMLNTLMTVCAFVHSIHLQVAIRPDETEFVANAKRSLVNQWAEFEKLLRSSYKKLHAYFQRYNIP